MDENNSNNNNPPSQRSKNARARLRTGAKIAAAVTAPAAYGAYVAGKAASEKIKTPVASTTPPPSEPTTPAATPQARQPVAPQDPSRASQIAKGVGKAGLKTLQYTTPTGLAYTAGRAAINKLNPKSAPPSPGTEEAAAVQEAEAIIREGTQQPGANKSNAKYGTGENVASSAQPAEQATSSTPPSTPAPSRAKTVGKKTAKTAGKVFLYSNPGIFLSGLLGSRIKQRFFAKKEIEDIEKEGEVARASNSSPPKPTGPKKPSRFQAFRKTKLWKIGTAPIKYGTLGGLFYVGAKKAKAKRSKSTESQETPEETTTSTPAATTPTPHPKKWLDYQTLWNNSRIKKAIDRGYNRFALLQKIRNSKALKTTWKYGKYAALGPIVAGGVDVYGHHKRKQAEVKAIAAQRLQNKSTEKYDDTQLWEGYGSSGTPSTGIGKRVISRFTSPRMPSLNSRLGRTMGNRPISRGIASAGQNAASQATQQVAEAAAKAFLKTPAGWTTVGVILLVILIMAVVMVIITTLLGGGDGGGDAVGGGANVGVPAKNSNPIVGLTLRKSVSPTALTTPDEITYTISYSFTPPATSTVTQDSITIFDTVPENTTLVTDKTTGNFTLDASGKILSWALSDPTNKALNSFSFTVIPTTTNVVISNTAYATANGTVAPPGAGGLSPNSCTQPHEGTGYCSYENLLPYFNNQPTAALTASLICQLESGSNPFQTNKVCPDYSIGLFQINLVAHCGGAYANLSCTQLVNPTIRAACEQRFLDPAENIKYAYQLYLSGGTGYNSNKWSVYPRVQAILASCGTI